MDATANNAETITKETESAEGDQPPLKETASTKAKTQNKCACDGSSSSKTRTSREEKMRKKDDKSVEHVLKALNSLNTPEEKLAAMCKKYADIFDENRKVQLALKQAEKRCSILQREKEQMQTEQSKAILTRSRLENLCRELQRQNKAIKDESLSKIREEEEKRKEVSAKFQSTLSEINHLMQQNNDKNTKLRDDNLDMNARLKSVCEQYELREQEVDRISKQMQLEAQLAEAKLAKAKMEMAAEREILIREKQQLLIELTQYQARCQEFQTNEINLRKQISLYNEKYDEFQRALAKSNEVFGGFKVEMDKMSKKILKLEKETVTWKQRWETSHQAFLNIADDKQRTDQELGLVNRQLGALQGLCRTLQTERTAMLSKLKEAGIQKDQVPILTNGEVNSDSQIVKEQDPASKVNSNQENSTESPKATTSSLPKTCSKKQASNNATKKEVSNLPNTNCSVDDVSSVENQPVTPCPDKGKTDKNRSESQSISKCSIDSADSQKKEISNKNDSPPTDSNFLPPQITKVESHDSNCNVVSSANQVPSSLQHVENDVSAASLDNSDNVDKSQISSSLVEETEAKSSSTSIPLVPAKDTTTSAPTTTVTVSEKIPGEMPPTDDTVQIEKSVPSTIVVADDKPIQSPDPLPDPNKKERAGVETTTCETPAAKITSNSSSKDQNSEVKKSKESKKKKK